MVMVLARKDHIKFLNRELIRQTEKYILTNQTSAIALLETDEVYSSQFIKIKDGLLILKFKNTRSVPRKGEYLTAVLINGRMSSYLNWGNITWVDLRHDHQIAFLEVKCVYHSKSEVREYSIAGFSGITQDFANKLEPGCIVILGPQEPPSAYLRNLIRIVSSANNKLATDKFLDIEVTNTDWFPAVFKEKDDFPSFILTQISLSSEVLIQGPPGTGKTNKMAALATKLINEQKSVLVTALTHRALIELAKKEYLKDSLEESRVFKTNMTLDELHELPKLKDSVDVVCQPGTLCLSTFYKVSEFASYIQEVPPFDFVIMDEASQSFLAMFACSKLLGKNLIWIGDPYQLPPITSIEEEEIIRNNYSPMIEGFLTICKSLAIPAFMLVESYRLSPRAAEYTSLFYANPIKSSVKRRIVNLSYLELNLEVRKFFHPNGGPSLIKLSFPREDPKPEIGMRFVVGIVAQLLKISEKDFEIAVLAKFKKTVREIQKSVANILGDDRNLTIETVERVQGLTCDVCIYFIPNYMVNMSLEKHLFNVATSRSQRHTIIIADTGIATLNNSNQLVLRYLQKLDLEYSFDVSSSPDMKSLDKLSY